MSTFVSTRGGPPVPLGEALFRGLAADGGLYMPTRLPSLRGGPDAGGTADFADSAASDAPCLLSDLDGPVAKRLAREAFTFPVPLVEVEPGVHVLELFHGPTHAFKDVGARFMAVLMEEMEAPTDDEATPATILVATSGDTGGAVASAFHERRGRRVVVLFPRDGITDRQRRQMSTLGGNVTAVAVAGTFDDCQRMAKDAFANDRLRAEHRLTSANSINVGRLLPQCFYYLHAARLLAGTPALFVVPTGNMGNLCAGLIAQASGMPAAGFLAATNVNDVFGQFLATGNLEERPSIPTISSAMDVGRPSNLERIRWLFRDDPDRLGRVVRVTSVDDAETRHCIADVYERTGYVLDPHSAVAYRAADRHHDRDAAPAVVLATAHPAKFPEVVESAIGRTVEPPDGLRSVMEKEERFSEIAPTLDALETLLDATTSNV